MSSKLGQAVKAKRSDESTRSLAPKLGISQPTLTRIELGTHRPTYDTARALATWLGWSVDEVMAAAEAPVEPAGDAQP